MNNQTQIRISKFLSLVLRHQPEAAGITLDEAGWVEVEELLAGCAGVGRAISMQELVIVVDENPKKRYEFNAGQTRIRASQGHSVTVDLQYEARTPPELLYHGTATRFIESIRSHGLSKMNRHHVHLSEETEMTMAVGARHGKPVLLTIQSGNMHRQGFEFHLSTNGVWLVNHVPSTYIQFP